MMRNQLVTRLNERINQYVNETDFLQYRDDKKMVNKIKSLKERFAEIVHVKAWGNVTGTFEQGHRTAVDYSVHYQYFIKQKKFFYIEEEVEQRRAWFDQGQIYEDKEVLNNVQEAMLPVEIQLDSQERLEYSYDRLKAVQYAERWWNSRNPAYKSFDVDCTNFISQCLRAGNAPRWGAPNRSRGWWYTGNNWSYSWAVANSLRLYLSKSKTGLQAREVKSPEELLIGDVICYDFEGDGRFNHNTIVTGKDHYGMPLVNAHTSDSRLRYWAYEDSTAYTPNIKYKFFTIVDSN
jgi:hypothetical protein